VQPLQRLERARRGEKINIPRIRGNQPSRALKLVLKPAWVGLSRHEQPPGLCTTWVWVDFIDVTDIRGVFFFPFLILHPVDGFPRNRTEARSSSLKFSFEAENPCPDAQGCLPMPGGMGRIWGVRSPGWVRTGKEKQNSCRSRKSCLLRAAPWFLGWDVSRYVAWRLFYSYFYIFENLIYINE